MADLSLDEFIRKRNVHVRLSNNPKGAQRKANFRQQSAIMVKNDRSKQVGRVFDARQKLGGKVTDAREKIIINKKSGKGDARNKIVSKQVQKGQFDARSLIKRQKKTNPGPQQQQQQSHVGVRNPVDFAVTRTLSNASAKRNPQIQVTQNGLQVTRQVPNTQVSMRNNSIQVTRRNQFQGGDIHSQGRRGQVERDFVPIIQIRNDRYTQPTAPSVPPQHGLSHQYYGSEPAGTLYKYENQLEDFDTSYRQAPAPAFSSYRGYHDLDDPQYNSAASSVPQPSRLNVSNLRAVEAAGMRPVSYSSSSRQQQQQSRAPPGAATLSQGGARLAGSTRVGTEVSARPLQAGAKRKQAAPPPAKEVSGPLRLGRGGGPGIELRSAETQHQGPSVKRPKFTTEEVSIEKNEDADFISPLQGFRVVVTNLFNGVTQDDIIELFGAVGTLKKAKLLKAGTAEVVYLNRKDALSAVQKYHSRELDGQPMYVKMTTSQAAVIKKVAGDDDPDITGEALRLYKKGTGIGSLPEAPIEIPTIHRALFKAGPPALNKSVKFTVKI